MLGATRQARGKGSVRPGRMGYTRAMPLEFAAATDVGRKRDHNEDALLVMPEHSLAVVCDGMGGHEAGEVASGIGVETVKRFFELAGSAETVDAVRRNRIGHQDAHRAGIRRGG